jgi:response regulator of citrate/malate metabolism
MTKTLCERLIEAQTGLNTPDYLKVAIQTKGSARAVARALKISHTSVRRLLEVHGWQIQPDGTWGQKAA